MEQEGRRNISQGILFSWFSDVLAIGSIRQLELNDLPHLPITCKSINCTRDFQIFAASKSTDNNNDTNNNNNNDDDNDDDSDNDDDEFSKNLKKKIISDKNDQKLNIKKLIKINNAKKENWLFKNNKKFVGFNSLLSLIFNVHGSTFFILGLLKLTICCASFLGPILLGKMVEYIEDDDSNIKTGLLLVSSLGFSFIFSAMLNTLFNIRAYVMQIKLKSALTRILFSRTLRLPLYAYSDLDLTDSQLINLVQIDTEKVADTIKSLHDLWSLPLQIIIAFVLLYLQVRIAFIAGVAIIIIMIPINTIIANKIGEATKSLLSQKDKRIQILSEAIRNMKSVKMLSYEKAVFLLSGGYRTNEVKSLSTRKYLDAICVFLWATTPVLVPFATFSTLVLVAYYNDEKPSIDVSEVFTTLALLNMLIFPMNAYPWVINGVVEGKVSASRIINILSSKDGKNMIVGESLISKEQHYKNMNKPTTNKYTSNNNKYEQLNIDDEIEIDFNKNNITNNDVIKTDLNYNILNIESGMWIIGSTNESLEYVENDNERDTVATNISSNTIAPTFYVGGNSDGINLSCTTGQIYAITGGVASGKTSLLLSCLGEIRMLKGKIEFYNSHGSSIKSTSSNEFHSSFNNKLMSYCPQSPIIHSGTVQSNIIMGSVLDKNRFNEIVQGCCLKRDIEKNWAKGEYNEVGNAGSSLSGGQKLRIGVARALYASTSIVLLDDPFSALDQMTSNELMKFLKYISIKENRLIILVTHSVSLLKDVNCIILLKGGQEEYRGNYDEMIEKSTIFNKMVQQSLRSENNNEIINVEKKDVNLNIKSNDIVLDDANVNDSVEKMEVGKINMNIYMSYFRSVGYILCFVIISTTMLMQATSNLMAYWYALWSSTSGSYTITEFIIISSIIVGANIFCAFLRSFLFAFGGLKACKLLYNNLISSLLDVNLSFYEENSIGIIINRIGKDTYCLDDQLPFMLNIVLAQVFSLLGTFVIISYTDPIVIVILVFVFFSYYKLQKFYRKSSRELRRLESIYKSPVYSHISECISNSPTLRSLCCIKYFEDKLENLIDNSNRVTLSLNVASQWLSMRLQLLGSLIATSLALSATLSKYYNVFTVSPELLGLSIVYSLSIVNNLNGLIGSVTETEQEMISVERVLDYSNLKNEFKDDNYDDNDNKEAHPINIIDLNDNEVNNDDDLLKPLLNSQQINNIDTIIKLPSSSSIEMGSIKIKSLSMKYNNGAVALRDLNINIEAGSKVAIVGRTGSGKSSLIRVLLRLNEYNGSVLISGNELRDIAKKKIRNRISVIPQDPLIFTGTIAFNLDPIDEYPRSKLIQVLELSGFSDTFKDINERNNNNSYDKSNHLLADDHVFGNWRSVSNEDRLETLLDYNIVEAGINLSQGQKQLLCLARAFLTESKIILMDEVTSSIDPASELLILNILNNKLKNIQNATLLIICHKISDGILNLCNKVLRMEDGQCVSYDDINTI